MSENSRVKKYEDLRKDIVSNLEGEEMSNTVKVNIFEEKGTDEVDNLIAQRVKKTEINPEEDMFVTAVMKDSIDAQQNEYFDDFIDEVRQYNIDKGTKSDYNTQIDILRQLKDQSEQQRKRYVEEIKETEAEDEDEIYTSTLSSEEIAAQVRSLIFDDREEEQVQLEPEIEDTIEDSDEIQIEVQTYKPSLFDQSSKSKEQDIVEENTVEKNFDEDATIQLQLLEQTQKLKKQVETYEGELNNITTNLSKNNAIMNRVLLIFIFLLIGCIFFFGYLLLDKVGLF